MSSSPRKRPTSPVPAIALLVIVIAAFCALAVAPVWGGRSAWDMMFPVRAATSQAHQVSDLYTVIMAIAAAVFLVVESLIVWSVIRYRRRPEDTELPAQTHGNNLLEVIWTLIPTVIVLVLFVMSLNTLNTVDAISPTPDVQIRAVAGQFQWQFDYLTPDGKTKLFTESTPLAANGGGMVVPAGETVHLSLTSPDVIHAFYVPRFLFKRDVVPGMLNNFDFTIDGTEAGQTYRGQCAELCGIGHWTMQFDVVVKSPADFDAYVKEKTLAAQATPAPRPSGAAAALELTAKNVQYDKKDLSVAADQPFSIHFTNADPAGLAHDVDIRQTDGKTVLQDKPTTDGGKDVTYDYTALKAGTYTFICSVHPQNMSGTLTVK
jgi:cytochrome c oxidase subunit 2